MAELELDGVGKDFGPVCAVRAVDLTIPPGKLACFLGPSGCGKTTLLRIVAGLEAPTRGRVRLDGTDITDRPAHRRNFGMVFQSLALFDHLTVGENIAYALRIRGRPRAAQRVRIEELLALVRLPGIAGRHVAQISGGQRQRVAIARALASEPRLFLLDEPLSALDAKLREAMQIELRLLQQRLGITTVLVTHDQREAMTMSDLVVVMNHAEIQQVGPPLDIYRRPANSFVADFIGASNLLPARVLGGDRLSVCGAEIAAEIMPEGLARGSDATLLIRPEEVHLHPPGADRPNLVPGRVTFIRDVGTNVETLIDCAGQTVVAVATSKDRPPVGVGDAAAVELPAAACVVLDR
jgi:putative spermidine/putrescine transport system ATP-binding protein